jgi:broad specificity phosphatase PhoE
MKRILIVRHGTTDANAAGVMRGATNDPLSDLGREQAKQVAAAIGSDQTIECIYTSTLTRAAETGDIIRQVIDVPIQRDEKLCELNIGEMEGCTESELWDYLSAHVDHEKGLTSLLHFSFPGGEMLSAFLARVSTAMFTISKTHEGTVVVVAHGVVTMVALGLWLEPKFSLWKKFLVDNCSITEVSFEPAPKLVRLNDKAHLQSV